MSPYLWLVLTVAFSFVTGCRASSDLSAAKDASITSETGNIYYLFAEDLDLLIYENCQYAPAEGHGSTIDHRAKCKERGEIVYTGKMDTFVAALTKELQPQDFIPSLASLNADLATAKDAAVMFEQAKYLLTGIPAGPTHQRYEELINGTLASISALEGSLTREMSEPMALGVGNVATSLESESLFVSQMMTQIFKTTAIEFDLSQIPHVTSAFLKAIASIKNEEALNAVRAKILEFAESRLCDRSKSLGQAMPDAVGIVKNGQKILLEKIIKLRGKSIEPIIWSERDQHAMLQIGNTVLWDDPNGEFTSQRLLEATAALKAIETGAKNIDILRCKYFPEEILGLANKMNDGAIQAKRVAEGMYLQLIVGVRDESSPLLKLRNIRDLIQRKIVVVKEEN